MSELRARGDEREKFRRRQWPYNTNPVPMESPRASKAPDNPARTAHLRPLDIALPGRGAEKVPPADTAAGKIWRRLLKAPDRTMTSAEIHAALPCIDRKTVGGALATLRRTYGLITKVGYRAYQAARREV